MVSTAGSGGSDSSKGDYFETTADGKVRLKQGKKKIDLNKLTSDDLRKLGIDPNVSKQEIARLLKVRITANAICDSEQISKLKIPCANCMQTLIFEAHIRS